MSAQGIKLINLNYPQLRSQLMNAKETQNMWSRGVGKTFDIGLMSAHVAHQMPGGTGVFVGRTYKQLEELVLTGVKSVWKRMGYVEGVHFVIGKKPKDWLVQSGRFKLPLLDPLSWEHFIGWYTGFGYYMVSQDRQHSFRGPSVDYVFVDEMLTIKRDQLEDEVLAANRGNNAMFRNVKIHHGIHTSSSKPIGLLDRWILESAKYYELDGNFYQPKLDEVVELSLDIIDTDSMETRQRLWKELQKLRSSIKWYISKEGVFYNEAMLWDNIHNLGWGWVKQQRRKMLEMRFRVEILNQTITSVDGSFYPKFNISTHVYYDSINYEAIGNSCLKDKDLDPFMKIVVGQDYGGRFNCMTVSQDYPDVHRFLNAFHVYPPDKMKELCEVMCDYYEPHSHKEIDYVYDHTGNSEQANSKMTMAQECAAVFRKRGWKVNLLSRGGAKFHSVKFQIVNDVLDGVNSKYKRVEINGNNCKPMITSVQLAPLKRGAREFEKDKSSEAKDNIDQADATHYSDVFDIVVVSFCSKRTIITGSPVRIPGR